MLPTLFNLYTTFAVLFLHLELISSNGSVTKPPNVCPPCPQRRQSPINIDSKVVPAKFPDLKFSPEYSQVPNVMTIINDGEMVKLSVKFNVGNRPTLSGGPLLHRYKFEKLHFHWGTNNSVGSEHTFNNISFPMEIHAVHIRENLTPAQADNLFDGYAVIAYFVEISSKGSVGFNSLTQGCESLLTNPTANLTDRFPLSGLLPQFSTDYYTYSGSLTTPPFTEAVMWILSQKPVPITQKQLNTFRELADKFPAMKDSFRATQPLNGRIVNQVSS